MRAANFNATVLSNESLGDQIFLMTVKNGENAPAPKAGQFYMLRAWKADEAPILSRPISLHFYDAASGTIGFLYEQKGIGTEKIAALKAGETLQLTGPSGNGFPLENLSGTVAVVGGGIGIAPLLGLVQSLSAQCVAVDFYAGFRDKSYCLDAFRAVCRNVYVATNTGSEGHKGFVTDLLAPEKYTAVCACGPEIMMEKTAKMTMRAGVAAYVSKEAKMACGVGACLGCTCKKTDGGRASVCKNGPVFEGSAVYELD